MTPKELAELRRKLLKDNPLFKRRLFDKLSKFQNQDTWRKPKGRDNKVRLQRRGYPSLVKVGYRNAKIIRGIHPSGYVPVVIHNEKELEKLDPKKHILYIGHTVGLRKKLKLEKLALEKGFRIANAEVS